MRKAFLLLTIMGLALLLVGGPALATANQEHYPEPSPPCSTEGIDRASTETVYGPAPSSVDPIVSGANVGACQNPGEVNPGNPYPGNEADNRTDAPPFPPYPGRG